MANAAAEGHQEKGEPENAEETEAADTLPYYPSAPSSELFDISTTVDPSYIISLIRKLLPHSVVLEHGSQGSHGAAFVSPNKFLDSRGNEVEAMESINDHDGFPLKSLTDEHVQDGNLQFDDQKTSPEGIGMDDGIYYHSEASERTEVCDDGLMHAGAAALEDTWEEYGCILWDLAADKSNSELMVENLLLDVLLASLSVSKSMRVKEICLGIIGNLACHEVPRNLIISTKGLIETAVDQLFLDDSPCLSETCRLLTLGLQSTGAVTWARALQHEYMLCRILWIAGNTLNSRLLEKSLELLLAILESQQVAPILLPPLMQLGFVDLLVDLLACEIRKLADEKVPDRDIVLDLILRVTEALSVVDNYSQTLSSSKELFQLVSAVIKLPDKVEVASSCVTAVVLLANLLTDEPNLATESSEDFSFIQGLLDTLPFVLDDLEARSALWSVFSCVLAQVQEDKMCQSYMRQFASVLADKSNLIVEDLDGHRAEDNIEDHKSSNSSSNCKNRLLRRIANILDMGIVSRGGVSEKDDVVESARKLSQYCRNYIA